jgi:hypothetical protein
VVSLQDNTLSLLVSKHFKDGLPVLTTIQQQKKELFPIIWWLQFNHFHLNSRSKEEDKSFSERQDQFKVISKNLMGLLRAAAALIRVSLLQGCLLLKMVILQVKWCK